MRTTCDFCSPPPPSSPVDTLKPAHGGDGHALQASHAIAAEAALARDSQGAAVQRQVERKVSLTIEMLEAKLEEVKGAVMICYPMGLPQWDPVRQVLEGCDEGKAAVRRRQALSARSCCCTRRPGRLH